MIRTIIIEDDPMVAQINCQYLQPLGDFPKQYLEVEKKPIHEFTDMLVHEGEKGGLCLDAALQSLLDILTCGSC